MSAPELAWFPTLTGVLLRPRETFAAIEPGPVAPALKLAALNLLIAAIAAILTDDTLYLGQAGPVVARGVGMWLFGVLWLLGPQAFLFAQAARWFGKKRPLSQAQRGMAAFSSLFAVFGVLLSVAGMNPESALFVISWGVSLTALLALATYALYRFAEGAYALKPGSAVGAVLVFQLVHSIALVVALGVYFTLTS